MNMIKSNNRSVVLALTESEQTLLNNYKQLSNISKGRFYGRLETLCNQESKQHLIGKYAACKEYDIKLGITKKVLKSSLTEDEYNIIDIFRFISPDRQFNAVNKLNELLAKEYTAKIIPLKR